MRPGTSFTVTALCVAVVVAVAAIAASGCSAIFSFDEFRVGTADAALPDGAQPDATVPDGGDASLPPDGGTDAGPLVCPGTLADCNMDGLTCESDLAIDRVHCGGCASGDMCGAAEGCWAGACDFVEKLVFGHAHACALLHSKRVVCWGSNSHGQLGNGTRTSSERPVAVNLGEDADDVAAGAEHSCALLHVGTIRCWGGNPNGEVGVTTHDDQLLPAAPIAVPASGDFTAVTAGVAHTCALATGSSVYCWGSDRANQLRGGAGVVQSDSPLLVPALVAGIDSIEAGGSTTCVVAAGRVYCWGLDDHFQRGTTAGDTMAAPVQKVGGDLTNVVSVSVGLSHACAVTSAGELFCWGSNGAGEIGNGVTTDTRPAHEPFTAGISSVTAGAASTCAISGTSVYCWGSNRDGQARDVPEDGVHSLPSMLDGLVVPPGVVLAQEWSTVCLVGADAVSCWGNDAWGQAGRQARSLQQPTPTDISGLTVTALGAGSDHMCSLGGGRARCWGANEGGQLGDGTRRSRSAPAEVTWTAMSPVLGEIAGGDEHTCIVGNVGAAFSAWCWGANSDGELGDGTTVASTAPVMALATMQPSRLAAGSHHTCVSSLDMLRLQCWGSNGSGESGAVAGTAVHRANDVMGLPSLPIGSMAAGADQTCAIVGSRVYCFGNNAGGLLGLSPPTQAAFERATEVVGPTSAVSIAAGNRFTCLLAMDGTVSCWGRNDRGQLGDGAFTDRQTPRATLPLGGAARALVAGAGHACVIAAFGMATRVVCWGANDEGQCGAAELGVIGTPAPVPGTGDIEALAAGRDFTCGRRTSGAVTCWGSRTAGRLGDGINLFQPTAAPPFWSP